MEENKVFVVTSGEYSGYQIEAIFTTRFLAEKYLSACGLNDHNIEEWALDEWSARLEQGFCHYGVDIWENGDLRCPATKEHSDNDGYSFPWFAKERGEKPFLRMFCWAKDEKHAVKITNEKRIQLIAENRWGERNEGWMWTK